MTSQKSAFELEREILGEWVRVLPCGCVMRIDEVFVEEGWFLTDHALAPCAEHPAKRLTRGRRSFCGTQMQLIAGTPYEVLGPMEGRWFRRDGLRLRGQALKQAKERSSYIHDGGILVGWRRWDGNSR
jgi:hypothetical protein